MKRPAQKTSAKRVIALALTWDGARWPARTLPPRARAFLAVGSHDSKRRSAKALTQLFGGDQVKEIRVCWVPRLKGGEAVLSDPFQTASGKRMGFPAVRTVHFDDILGVVYRRR